MSRRKCVGRVRSRRGFTLVELGAVIAVTAAGVGSMVAVTGVEPDGGTGAPGDPPRTAGGGGAELVSSLVKARAAARQLKDATHVRGIVQSLVIWSQTNKGSYPLPGLIDTANATVALNQGQAGASKNTTANIFSLLVFNGSISPEICVSPAEVSKKVTVKQDYQFTSPSAAASPANALWDPSFSADLTRSRPGSNVSYAHLQPSAGRLKMWSDSFNSAEAVVGNRAPAIAAIASDDQGDYSVKLRNEKSKTLRIHGDPKTWEGNVGFNDGHVEFSTTLAPPRLSPEQTWAQYAAKDPMTPGKTVQKLDCWFIEEPDNSAPASDIYLGVWLKAGDKAGEFRGVWD